MKKLIFCVTNDLVTDQRMMRICRTLCNAGFEVEIVGRKKKNSKPTLERSFKQTRLNCFFEKGKLFYLEFNIRLLFYLFFNRFDIAGSVDLDTIVPVFVASKLKSKPATFDAHEYFEEVPEVTNRKMVKRIWSKIGEVFIPKMKLCYTIGSALAEIFKQKYKIPFHVIRNMPMQKDISKVMVPLIAQPYMLYQGALNEGRGIEQMIQIMKFLPEYRLILAGDGDLADYLKQMVSNLELEKRVLFVGNLHPEQLDSYTAGAYIGLNLLENKGLSYYYSLANKFFDYVQFGVPVVTMKFPEYVALNEQHEVAILLPDLEAETLKSALKSLHDDIHLHQRLRMNCMMAAKEWHWENESVMLTQLYKDI